MDMGIATVATVAAFVFAITAVVLFLFGQHVISGTFFVLTAFAIYLRETNT